MKVEPTLSDLPSRGQGVERGEKGVVTKLLANGIVQVRLKEGQLVAAHFSERLRLCPVRLLVGDRVLVQTSALDPSRGRVLQKLGED
jgi:translation initiation factor IF-1